jgi:hypothetical protein
MFSRLFTLLVIKLSDYRGKVVLLDSWSEYRLT